MIAFDMHPIAFSQSSHHTKHLSFCASTCDQVTYGLKGALGLPKFLLCSPATTLMFQGGSPQSSPPFVNFNLAADHTRATAVSDRLKVLRESLKALPYIGGVRPVTVDGLGLYYDVLGDRYPRCVLSFIELSRRVLTSIPVASIWE